MSIYVLIKTYSENLQYELSNLKFHVANPLFPRDPLYRFI